jgi:hypothetical protein
MQSATSSWRPRWPHPTALCTPNGFPQSPPAHLHQQRAPDPLVLGLPRVDGDAVRHQVGDEVGVGGQDDLGFMIGGGRGRFGGRLDLVGRTVDASPGSRGFFGAGDERRPAGRGA